MRIFKISSVQFFHGSYDHLPIGTILTPEKGNFMSTFEKDEMESHFILEKHKPPEYISRNQAVYMCDNIDDLDNAGAATTHVYRVNPLGKIEQHDLAWMSAIDVIRDESFLNKTQKSQSILDRIKQAAFNYWTEVSSNVDPVWEYLTTSAEIVEEMQWSLIPESNWGPIITDDPFCH